MSVKQKGLVIILLLLGVNITMLVMNLRSTQKQEFLAEERTRLLEERDSLVNAISTIQLRLSSELGANTQLNRLIEEKTQELDSVRHQFNISLFDQKLSNDNLKTLLADAKFQIDSLTVNYESQIAVLTTQLQVAEQTTASLQKAVDEQKTTIASLKESLEQAEVFRINAVDFSAMSNASGNLKPTSIAQRTDALEICIDFAKNQIVPPGKQDVLVRILGPDGTTLAVQSNGSGTFTLAKEKVNSVFSKKLNVNYAPNGMQELCTLWEQSFPYKAGKYIAEVYHKGILVKTAQLQLKNKTVF